MAGRKRFVAVVGLDGLVRFIVIAVSVPHTPCGLGCRGGAVILADVRATLARVAPSGSGLAGWSAGCPAALCACVAFPPFIPSVTGFSGHTPAALGRREWD